MIGLYQTWRRRETAAKFGVYTALQSRINCKSAVGKGIIHLAG